MIPVFRREDIMILKGKCQRRRVAMKKKRIKKRKSQLEMLKVSWREGRLLKSHKRSQQIMEDDQQSSTKNICQPRILLPAKSLSRVKENTFSDKQRLKSCHPKTLA